MISLTLIINLVFWLADQANRSIRSKEGSVQATSRAELARVGLPVQKRSQNSERFPANEDVL